MKQAPIRLQDCFKTYTYDQDKVFTPVETVKRFKKRLQEVDLDILKELAQINCISVNISITSLSEKTRRLLEPRTASIKQRLKVVEVLSEHNIPVRVMMAPIIPSLNSHEILPLVQKVSELGAKDVAYTVVRLNGQIAEIFSDWIHSY